MARMLRAANPIPAGLSCDVPYPSQAPVFTRIGPEGLAPVEPEPPSAPAAAPIDAASLLELLRTSPASVSRRTCPDLFGQMQYALAQRMNTIVCNLMDDDGPPPVQAALAAAFSARILRAVVSLAEHSSARRALICIPDNAPAWLRDPLALVKGTGIGVQAVEACYPRSHASLLLPMLLGKRLSIGRLPVERGVLLLDAFAAAEIGFALERQRGLEQSPLAVGDHVRGQSHYLLTPPEMAIGQVLTTIGAAHDAMLLAGDLPGERVVGAQTPASQCALKLHVLPRRAGSSPAPCTRCGACVEHCPTGVHPAGLLEAAQQDDPDIARRAGIDACILCGICSLVCPSQLPLVRSIRTLLP